MAKATDNGSTRLEIDDKCIYVGLATLMRYNIESLDRKFDGDFFLCLMTATKRSFDDALCTDDDKAIPIERAFRCHEVINNFPADVIEKAIELAKERYFFL